MSRVLRSDRRQVSMKRFFFDYHAKDEVCLDFCGQEFSDAGSALDFASEIVMGLKHSLTTDWSKWSVEVRAVDGERYFSLPIAAELPIP